jgi:hypothetical protein
MVFMILLKICLGFLRFYMFILGYLFIIVFQGRVLFLFFYTSNMWQKRLNFLQIVFGISTNLHTYPLAYSITYVTQIRQKISLLTLAILHYILGYELL